jgi:hypothetical protein
MISYSSSQGRALYYSVMMLSVIRHSEILLLKHLIVQKRYRYVFVPFWENILRFGLIRLPASSLTQDLGYGPGATYIEASTSLTASRPAQRTASFIKDSRIRPN